jgi:ADP-ribose pyrophosphatase YjhB (NUDIX family)
MGLLRSAYARFGNAAIRVANLARPELSLGVRLLALDAGGRVFLVRHSYLPDLHLPGGAVDEGESCHEAVSREAREEGNLALAEPPALFALYWNPVGGRRDHVVLFVARGVRQTAPRGTSLEIVAAGFHDPAALPEGVSRPTRDRLAEVLGGRPPAERW